VRAPGRRETPPPSEPRIYGDWKDGTQAYFNPQFGEAWLARMRRLGFDGEPERLRARYRDLRTSDFSAIATEMPRAGQVYAVVDSKHTPLELPLTFESSQYRVYRLR